MNEIENLELGDSVLPLSEDSGPDSSMHVSGTDGSLNSHWQRGLLNDWNMLN